MAHNEPMFWSTIKIVVNGVAVTGAYSVDNNDLMTVRMDGGGTKIAQGGRAAEGTAKLILGELFNESSRR